MTTIYWAGGEDSDCFQVGGGSVLTTANYYRASYARCALNAPSSTVTYWQNTLLFNQSAFWFTFRFGSNTSSLLSNGGFGLCDSSSIRRIRIRATGTGTFVVEKVNAAGAATQLGSSVSYSTPVVSSTVLPDKWDINLVYAVSGSITIYLNGVQLFSYSGDVTTDSVTSLAGFQLGSLATGGANNAYSEIIVADNDTRNMSLQTLAPVANGNTHNFDTGSPAAANVNETTLSDTTVDGSTTAGQVDQYTIPSLVSGSFSIVAVGVSARMTKGASGPTKMDLGVRSGGADYWSADQALAAGWSGYQNWWATDPATSAAWTALPTNIGLKSVA